jgi:hypothetical protein
VNLNLSPHCGNCANCGNSPRTSCMDGKPMTEGFRAGALVVVERAASKGGRAMWWCRCECGTEKIVESSSLKRGYPKSCTCRATTRARPTPAGSLATEVPMFANRSQSSPIDRRMVDTDIV